MSAVRRLNFLQEIDDLKKSSMLPGHCKKTAICYCLAAVVVVRAPK